MKELIKYVVFNKTTKNALTRELKSFNNAALLSSRQPNSAIGYVHYQNGKLVKTNPEGIKLL